MQKGRSMIEMLGVLAIIGVLSIGGLYAYRQAIIRHKINQTKNWFSRGSFALKEFYFSEPAPDTLNKMSSIQLRNVLCEKAGIDFCSDLQTGYVPYPYIANTEWYTRIMDTNHWGVTLRNLPKEYCSVILTTYWGENLYAMITSDTTIYPSKITPEMSEKFIEHCTSSKFVTLYFQID